ncbi:MAG: hypothetical protein JO224_12530 [Pelomonas sp.]|nr:hypothetical protein [Roseateles sp.]
MGLGLVTAALWTPVAFAGSDAPAVPATARDDSGAPAQQPFVKHLDHGPHADISPALYRKRIAEWRTRVASTASVGGR